MTKQYVGSLDRIIKCDDVLICVMWLKILSTRS